MLFRSHFVTLDNESVSLEEFFVPKEILPELEIVDSSIFTMKDIFAFYGIELCSMSQTMEIIGGASKMSKLLDTPEGIALIKLTCNYRDNNGRLIAYSRSFIRSDKSSFSIKLHK